MKGNERKLSVEIRNLIENLSIAHTETLKYVEGESKELEKLTSAILAEIKDSAYETPEMELYCGIVLNKGRRTHEK